MATVERVRYAEARQQAEQDFARHEMTVLHDQGVYRHVRFARPETNMYSYSLVTWPGYLTIAGDLESFTFCRVQDMFEFFAGNDDINPGYWSEKIPNPAARNGTRRYSRARLDAKVDAALTDWPSWDGERGARPAWKEHVEFFDLGYEQTARQALDAFDHDGYGFGDTSEWDLTDWDHHFLLACFAIKRGIDMYRADREVTDGND